MSERARGSQDPGWTGLGCPGGDLPGVALASRALVERGGEWGRERWKEVPGACNRGSLPMKNTNGIFSNASIPSNLTKSIQMAAEHGGPIPRGGVWPDSWRAALGSHDGRTRHPRWVPPPRPPGSLRCWCRGHWIPRSTSATPGDAPPLPSPAPPSDHHGLRLCSLSLRLLFCPSHLVPPCLFSPEL